MSPIAPEHDLAANRFDLAQIDKSDQAGVGVERRTDQILHSIIESAPLKAECGGELLAPDDLSSRNSHRVEMGVRLGRKAAIMIEALVGVGCSIGGAQEEFEYARGPGGIEQG